MALPAVPVFTGGSNRMWPGRGWSRLRDIARRVQGGSAVMAGLCGRSCG